MPDNPFTLRDAFLGMMREKIRRGHQQSPNVFKVLEEMRREQREAPQFTATDRQFLKSLRIASDAAE